MVGQKSHRDEAKSRPIQGWDLRAPFDRATDAFGAWAQGMSALTGEFAHFAQARLKEDMGAWARLAHCKSAGEAFELQSRYVQKMADDYFDEFGKMSSLAVKIANNPFSALQSKEPEPSATAGPKA